MAVLLITILKSVLKQLLVAMITEAFLKDVIIHGLKYIAKKTPNTLDDKLIADIETALQKGKSSVNFNNPPNV